MKRLSREQLANTLLRAKESKKRIRKRSSNAKQKGIAKLNTWGDTLFEYPTKGMLSLCDQIQQLAEQCLSEMTRREKKKKEKK